jgi:hypothetical protein
VWLSMSFTQRIYFFTNDVEIASKLL